MENEIPWDLEKIPHRHWKMCHPMLWSNFPFPQGMENPKISSFSSTMKTEHLYYFKSLENMIIWAITYLGMLLL